MFLSFVIPCYRSEHTISSVVSEINIIASARADVSYEIILVNDGSPDDLQSVIERLCLEDSRVTGVELAKNFGQHSAQLAGYSMARGDVIVCLDDDGQTPINHLFLLIDTLEQGYDAVFADYLGAKKHSASRNFATRANQKVSEIVYSKPKHIHTSSFVVMRAFLAKQLTAYKNPFPSNSGFIFFSTKSVTSVPLEHRERIQGRSGYNLKRLFSLWANSVFNYSMLPLRISFWIGVLAGFSGFIYTAVKVIQKILGGAAPTGWTASVSLILIVGGLILIMLGITGEYVGRIFLSLNNIPQYVIRNVYGRNQGNEKNEKDG